MRRSLGPLGLLGLVGYLALGGSCSTVSSPYDDVEQWLCFEDEASCDCHGGPADAKVEDSRSSTPGCSAALDCCFIRDQADGSYECSCIETPADATGAGGAAGEGGASAERSPEARCLLAAADRGTTNVVAHCPPITLDSPAVCALTFESCAPEYLKQNGLVACCDGLVCQEDATLQRICVVAK